MSAMSTPPCGTGCPRRSVLQHGCAGKRNGVEKERQGSYGVACVQHEEDTGTGGCTDRAGLGVAYLNSCMQERWQLGCTTISI
jgi:hypothetical protein